jgi:hypothetical protein
VGGSGGGGDCYHVYSTYELISVIHPDCEPHACVNSRTFSADDDVSLVTVFIYQPRLTFSPM